MGILAFVVNFFWSRSMGEPAGDNPWLAGTLEWAISSPPPPYNFHVIPTVASAYPLWDTHAEYRHELLPDPEKMQRETVGTTVLEADPQAILNFPEDSPWPFILACCLAALFVGLLLGNLAGTVAGGLAAFLAASAWLWPGKEAEV